MSDLLAHENQRLRAELISQWRANHAEHCREQWPHPLTPCVLAPPHIIWPDLMKIEWAEYLAALEKWGFTEVGVEDVGGGIIVAQGLALDGALTTWADTEADTWVGHIRIGLYPTKHLEAGTPSAMLYLPGETLTITHAETLRDLIEVLAVSLGAGLSEPNHIHFYEQVAEGLGSAVRCRICGTESPF